MNSILTKSLASLELLASLEKEGLLNPQTARLLFAIKSKKDPKKEIELLQQILAVSKLFRSPFTLPTNDACGPIGLAYSENNQVIGMHPHECHVEISGQTGTGKSTLLRIIFSQALKQNIKVWLFVKAKELRSLLDLNSNILVINFGENTKLNLLNPCGIQTSNYCNIFSDIFVQSQTLYDGTKNYLLENLNRLYAKQQTPPSLFDLCNYVKEQRHPRFSRTSYYQDSLLNRLGGMLYGPLGNVFDCSEGYEKSLLDQNCIFEIDGLTKEQQIFVVNLLLTKLFYHRLHRNLSSWFFVGIDDGNLLFDASLEKRPDLGLPIIHNLLSTVRKSKINIFCCTQTPHQLGASIHSNSAVKITFSLSNGVDVDFIAKNFGNLNSEQKDFLYKLDSRQIILKNTLRYPDPILGTIPLIPEPREVGDSEIDYNNTRILSTFPSIVYNKQTHSPEDNTNQTESESSLKSEHSPKHEPVADRVKDWLMAVNLYQYKKTLTEISKLAGFSLGTGSRIAKECERKNLVKVIQIKIGKGSPRYPILLPDAYTLLGVQEKKFFGKGAGQEHILYQHLLAEHLAEYHPVIELNRGSKFIDLAIEVNNKLIAIEVAMTSAHERENIEKDYAAAKADQVIVACKDDKVLAEVRIILSRLNDDFQQRTRIVLLSDLLKNSPDNFIEKGE